MSTPVLPDVGKILSDYIEKKNIAKAAFARELRISTSTLAGYFVHKTMQVHTLIKVSTVLEHNFLREIADTLPATFEPTPIKDDKGTVADLQQQIVMLNKEIDTLKEALKLVGTGK